MRLQQVVDENKNDDPKRKVLPRIVAEMTEINEDTTPKEKPKMKLWNKFKSKLEHPNEEKKVGLAGSTIRWTEPSDTASKSKVLVFKNKQSDFIKRMEKPTANHMLLPAYVVEHDEKSATRQA